MIVGDVVKKARYGKIKMTVTKIYAGIVTCAWASKKRDGSYTDVKEKKFCIMQLKVVK
jgi:hypothetical protein